MQGPDNAHRPREAAKELAREMGMGDVPLALTARELHDIEYVLHRYFNRDLIDRAMRRLRSGSRPGERGVADEPTHEDTD